MRHGKPITLSVLIPCYNEAATIDRTLDAVLALGDQVASDGITIQIVAVDDASKDATFERLTERANAAGERFRRRASTPPATSQSSRTRISSTTPPTSRRSSGRSSTGTPTPSSALDSDPARTACCISGIAWEMAA
jgi:cellulose synthase/poly-beta-1,6-N-acetylglucosamine synthase-like glycosyltransferase